MADLPLVTCLCPTYGRFARLREALACFLTQDYPNKRLLILNDAYLPIKLPGVGVAAQTPIHLPLSQSSPELPGVKVWNVTEGFSNLGEKRQALLKAANSPFVAHWDDDDLYLPWHLSICMAELRRPGAPISGPRCVQPSGAWYMPDGEVHGIHHNYFEGQIVFNRMEALELGGYTPKHSGQAADLMRAFAKARRFGRADLFSKFEPHPGPSYVYRWDHAMGHISALGDPKKGLLEGKNATALKKFQQLNRDFGSREPLTPADLTFHWADLIEAARKELSKADSEAFEARLVGARPYAVGARHAVPGGTR